jgi:hypothetical protein
MQEFLAELAKTRLDEEKQNRTKKTGWNWTK